MTMSKLKKVEVAVILGCSTATIDNWYKWKGKHPDSKYANLLPDYEKVGNAFYWNKEDAYKMLEFKRIALARKIKMCRSKQEKEN